MSQSQPSTETDSPQSPVMPAPAWRRWLVWGMTAAAVLAGGVWGFIGGDRIAGPWLGGIMAVNLALCAGLLTGAVAERWIGKARPTQVARRDH